MGPLHNRWGTRPRPTRRQGEPFIEPTQGWRHWGIFLKEQDKKSQPHRKPHLQGYPPGLPSQDQTQDHRSLATVTSRGFSHQKAWTTRPLSPNTSSFPSPGRDPLGRQRETESPRPPTAAEAGNRWPVSIPGQQPLPHALGIQSCFTAELPGVHPLPPTPAAWRTLRGLGARAAATKPLPLHASQLSHPNHGCSLSSGLGKQHVD